MTASTQFKYDEILQVQGVKIPFVPHIITPRIERPMRRNRYGAGECKATRTWVRGGDRVLELGGGVGLVSTVASQVPGVEKVVCIEANPELITMIQETHKLNGVSNVDIRNGIAAPESGFDVPFYLRGDFWASSMEPDSRPYNRVVNLPAYGLNDLVREICPTVISADIEGAELETFVGADLTSVRTIILELHPAVYGAEGQDKILQYLDKQGFRAEKEYLGGSVWILSREPQDAAPCIYTRGPTDPTHTKNDPTFLVATCMKNEGPFILEWLAYHRSIGIGDYVVFSNDCTDGTDLILDRLDEMGLVTHLPNPAFLSQSTFYQPMAMKYATEMRQVKAADYMIEMDVDEFINIRVGNGHMNDLLKAAGPFHVLSISELNFSFDGRYDYDDVWLTEAYLEHENMAPGHWQARRGVKSIIHGMENFKGFPVHRPGIYPGTEDKLIWLDGSGRPVKKDFIVNHENGMDRRGAYDLVQLDHHAIRSVQSFLIKQDRGDVVNVRNNVDHHYFRKRSQGGHSLNHIANKLPAARKEWHRLMQDKRLAELHTYSVKQHKARIAQIEERPNPSIVELRTWIMEKYFADQET